MTIKFVDGWETDEMGFPKSWKYYSERDELRPHIVSSGKSKTKRAEVNVRKRAGCRNESPKNRIESNHLTFPF